jgi:hypothetical protein
VAVEAELDRALAQGAIELGRNAVALLDLAFVRPQLAVDEPLDRVLHHLQFLRNDEVHGPRQASGAT